MDKKKLAFVWKKENQENKPQRKIDEKEAVPNKIDKNKHRGVQRSLHFKPILTAGISAVMIGSIMGVIMIQLFTNLTDVGGSEEHTAVTSPLPDEEDEEINKEENEGNNKKKGQAGLAGMNAYVLQAGVFSNQDNAAVSAKEYDQAGFTPVIWERDEQFYLLVGIAETKERGKKLAEEVGENELDIYLKEWVTEKSQAKLNKNDEQWIKSFEKRWEATLTLIEKEEEISLDEWASLSKEQLQGESVEAVEEMISEYLKEDKTELNVQEAQQLLLKTWMQYEQIQ